MTGLEIGVIAAITGVVGTAASLSAASKASKARRKQEQLQRRRSARQAIREAQIRRAQTVATAQGAGALGSSSVAGGAGALTSQLGERLGFSAQMSGLSNQISRYEQRAQTFGALGQLGFDLGGGQYIQGLFKGPQQQGIDLTDPRYGRG